MALPTTIGSKPRALGEAFSSIRSYATNTKRKLTAMNTASAGGTLTAAELIGSVKEMSNHRANLTALSQALGASGRTALNAYAKTELWDNALDFIAEGQAMASAVSAFITWANANIPADGFSYPTDPDGVLTNATFAAGSAFSIALRAQIQTVLATLD